MKRLLFGLMLLASPALAQDAVPQIPFDGSDPLKPPKDLYLGEVTGVAVNSKGHVFVLSRGNTTGRPTLPQRRSCSSSRPTARSFARSARTCTPGRSAIPSAWTERQHLDHGQGIGHGGQVQPRGRVTMVFGRKQEASDRETGPLERPNPPLPHEDGRFRQVTDVAFDRGRKRLHQRRIHQFARRQGRQERQMAQVVGSKGAKPGEFNTPHSIAADAKATSTWRTAVTGASRCSTARGRSSASSRSTCRTTRRHRPAIGNLPESGEDRGGGRAEDDDARRAVGGVHHARTETGAVRLRRVSGPRVQAVPGRKGARRAGPIRGSS